MAESSFAGDSRSAMGRQCARFPVKALADFGKNKICEHFQDEGTTPDDKNIEKREQRIEIVCPSIRRKMSEGTPEGPGAFFLPERLIARATSAWVGGSMMLEKRPEASGLGR
jgi:hypothetical protein